jgi:hypothetical protein
MIRAKNLGRIGVSVIVMIAGLVLTATPARANGTVRYENVGNPGWCMGAFINYVGPSLRACNASLLGQQWWWYSEPQGILLQNSETGLCLTAETSPIVATRGCGSNVPGQHWDVWGRNGWVVYQQPGTVRCMVPRGTAFPASAYDLELITCPRDRINVPNLFAWRYSS